MTNVIKTTNPLRGSSSVTTVMLRMHFPAPSTIATRTFDIDWNLTVDEAVDNIAEQMKDCGLKIKKGQIYVPQEDFILPGKDTLRKHSQLLASVDHVEFLPHESQLLYWVSGAVVAAAVVGGIAYYVKNKQES